MGRSIGNGTNLAGRAATSGAAVSVRKIMRDGKAVKLSPSARSLVRHPGGIGILNQLSKPARQQLYPLISLNQTAEHLPRHDIRNPFEFGNQSNLIIRKVAIIKTIAHG